MDLSLRGARSVCDEAISQLATSVTPQMGNRTFYVYILTNKNRTVLYTGVTNDLTRRVWEHKDKMRDGFTKWYNVDRLVYYEAFDDVREAIAREKQIKGGSRQKKIDLINGMNKDWRDLYEEL